jgi:hypothetical protein
VASGTPHSLLREEDGGLRLTRRAAQAAMKRTRMRSPTGELLATIKDIGAEEALIEGGKMRIWPRIAVSTSLLIAATQLCGQTDRAPKSFDVASVKLLSRPSRSVSSGGGPEADRRKVWLDVPSRAERDGGLSSGDRQERSWSHTCNRQPSACSARAQARGRCDVHGTVCRLLSQ